MQLDPTIPFGLCQCGCGRPTSIAKITYPERGWIKGQPIRYLVGHATRRHGDPAIIARYFWPLVDRGDTDTCWRWLGTMSGEGYGEIPISGKKRSAHRLAWELTVGPIPDDLCVLHTCDNRACCNPAHLFLGTHQDNMTDMVAKGRSRAVRGEAAKQARLTEAQVREARALFRKRHPEFGYTGLGRKYGVSPTAVYDAIRGRRWAHVK